MVCVLWWETREKKMYIPFHFPIVKNCKHLKSVNRKISLKIMTRGWGDAQLIKYLIYRSLRTWVWIPRTQVKQGTVVCASNPSTGGRGKRQADSWSGGGREPSRNDELRVHWETLSHKIKLESQGEKAPDLRLWSTHTGTLLLISPHMHKWHVCKTESFRCLLQKQWENWGYNINTDNQSHFTGWKYPAQTMHTKWTLVDTEPRRLGTSWEWRAHFPASRRAASWQQFVERAASPSVTSLGQQPSSSTWLM